MTFYFGIPKIAVMFTPRTNRRILLTLLVLIALIPVLTGCAEYEIRQPMAERGTVLVTWRVSPSEVPKGHCGWAQEISRGHYLITFTRVFDLFNEPCPIHELGHVMGATHK